MIPTKNPIARAAHMGGFINRGHTYYMWSCDPFSEMQGCVLLGLTPLTFDITADEMRKDSKSWSIHNFNHFYR